MPIVVSHSPTPLPLPTPPPLITTLPASKPVPAGSTVSFTVNATGSQPFTYQWQFYGTNLPGANAQTLVLPNVQNQNAGPYSVLLTNAYGYAASDAATLSVTPSAPVVLLDPA